MEWINEGPDMNDNHTENEPTTFCAGLLAGGVAAACIATGLLCNNLCLIKVGK